MINPKNVAKFFVTACYIGKIKIAPGTFGSLPAFPICYIIVHFVLNNKILFSFESYTPDQSIFITIFLISIIVVCFLFIIGTYLTWVYIKGTNLQDPKEVVIDEVVGQMLTIIFSSFSIVLVYNSKLPSYMSDNVIYLVFLIIMPFLLFRLFDIIKPWPISWLDENIPGALGIMVDDIAAAIFAVVSQYVIVFCVVDYFPISL
jgi:phosphatidylglycerophosphatase A